MITDRLEVVLQFENQIFNHENLGPIKENDMH